MKLTKHQIVVDGKTYGYWTAADGTTLSNVRSEDNPEKTPYLKEGSKTYVKVMTAIRVAQAE